MAWVLQSYFRLSVDEVAEVLSALLVTPGLDVENAAFLRAVIHTYRESHIDFTDAWIAECAKRQGVPKVYTFDRKHFARVRGLRAETP